MVSFTAVEPSETLLYPHSVVASHITPDEGMLYAKIPNSISVQLKVDDGNLLPIAGIGNLTIQTHTRLLKLSSVLHVPHLKHNLLSVRCLCCENNYHVQFSDFTFCDARALANEVQGNPGIKNPRMIKTKGPFEPFSHLLAPGFALF